jgi:hypothetical protein
MKEPRHHSANYLEAVVCALALAAVTGCADKDCTEKGCMAAVTIVFNRALPPDRVYEVEVLFEGQAACQSEQLRGECEHIFRRITTDNQVRVTLTGESLPTGGFAALQIQGEPSRIDVTISEGGALVAKQSFDSITYRGIEINGPGCGASCNQAAVFLSLPP